MSGRHTGKWCGWAKKPCPPECPIPSVDNFGGKYPGCALVRLKSLAEIDAESEAAKAAAR